MEESEVLMTAHDVFAATMALIDELDGSGGALTSDTREYELRTPGIVNMMIAEKRILCGERGAFPPVTDLSSELFEIDQNYALAVMKYGLAANLLVDENAAAAGFYQQRYEELRDRYVQRAEAVTGDITELYGGIEYGRFARW